MMSQEEIMLTKMKYVHMDLQDYLNIGTTLV